MRLEMCILLAAALSLLTCAESLSAQDRRPINKKSLGDMVQNLQVVIEGTISKVEVKYVESWKLSGGKPENDQTRREIVTEVTMNVERVIAGAHREREIRFLLEEGEIDGLHAKLADFALMKINPGERALLAINPNTLGTGVTILFNRSQFFRIEDDTLYPYQPEYYLEVDEPWEIIREKAKERAPQVIFDTADIVCMATVTELINPRGLDRKIVVSIDELLKGTAEARDLTVDVSDLFQPFRKQKPGYRVLLFLRRDGSLYRTVSGVNGYYVVDGNALKRGHNMPFWMDIEQMRSNIRIWKGAEK